MNKGRPTRSATLIAWAIVVLLLAFSARQLFSSVRDAFRGWNRETPRFTLRPMSHPHGKIRRDEGKQYLWAKGSRNPADESSEWFDMTGSPIKLEHVEHGIGKDSIASIDDPVFVKPDDPRLLKRWGARSVTDINRIPVIGFAHNGVARAYPVQLLNGHELVNDMVGGKPVAVAW